MSRYSKNLSGQKLKVIVSNPIEYTNDATFAAFVTDSPEGEIGVFLADGTLRTTALTAGQEFFIAQKRDGVVNKTPIIALNDQFRKKYVAYDAPVKQVTTLGYNGTAGTFGFNFAAAGPTTPQTYQISLRETTPGNQPFPVQEAYVVVRSTTQDQYTALASLVSQLNGDFDYERTQPDRFAIAEILSNGAKTNLTNNTTVVNLSVTVSSTAHGIASAGGLVELRDVVYKVASVVDANTFTIDRPYQGVSEVITAGANAATIAYTSGTTLLGVRFTAIEFESHFIVSPFTGLVNDTVTAITPWKLGAGAGFQVRALEEEGIIFDGVGSTVNAAFRADYGYPTLFSSLAKNYNLFFLEFAPTILPSAALPIYRQNQIERIVIAAPTDATTPSNELQTIFGL